MKYTQITFLTVDTVSDLHSTIIAETGGADGVRDSGLLASAVARPQQAFGDELVYPTIAGMAAALATGIALNHPFLDGNKRTAIAAGFTFLDINGFFIPQSKEFWMKVIDGVVCHRIDHEELVEAYVAHMKSDRTVILDDEF